MGREIVDVLIVEDEILIREMIEIIFQRAGISYRSAENGIDAILQLETCLPNMILLDINMPKMNGLEFIREMKKRNESYTYCMLTAYSDPDHIVESIQSGAEDYLAKPFEPNDLIAKVRRYSQKEYSAS